ncbi:MAG: response regulator [Proteobacteria bacterium]|nr:response regulator [Pseudomonadota bacterium]
MPTVRHVLLVEDHASLRQVLVATLEMLGYRVTAYASGTEALAALEAGAAPDLLLTDVRMAGVPDGLALATWVRDHRPGTPVLLQTGYTRLPTGGFPVLQKPFTPEELRRALAALFGDPA